MNMSQSPAMNPTNYEGHEIYEIHEAMPTRRRRSQPSLDHHPYQRPMIYPQSGVSTHYHQPFVLKDANNNVFYNTATFLNDVPATQSPISCAAQYYTTYDPSIGAVAIANTNTDEDVNEIRIAQIALQQSLRFQREISGYAQATTLSDAAIMAEYGPSLPNLTEFNTIMNEYITSLSPKKRDKALIPANRYNNIRNVLKDPKCTTIESAQFRFWAKKMFRLVLLNGNELVTHESKPVAIKESLFAVLTRAHIEAQHGGRDKTSTQVRKDYSWVPKELIARFVRSCPNCRARKTPVERNGYSKTSGRSRTSSGRTTPRASLPCTLLETRPSPPSHAAGPALDFHPIEYAYPITNHYTTQWGPQ